MGEKISFKNLIKSYRCLIIADGYYEWKREKSIKTPYYFERQDDETIFFAGIYKTKQFCIVTREATSNVGDIHDRQPVIINKKDLNDYLNLKSDGVDFLNSYEAPVLKFHPVSKDVNIPTNNNENFILYLLVSDPYVLIISYNAFIKNENYLFLRFYLPLLDRDVGGPFEFDLKFRLTL